MSRRTAKAYNSDREKKHKKRRKSRKYQLYTVVTKPIHIFTQIQGILDDEIIFFPKKFPSNAWMVQKDA